MKLRCYKTTCWLGTIKSLKLKQNKIHEDNISTIQLKDENTLKFKIKKRNLCTSREIQLRIWIFILEFQLKKENEINWITYNELHVMSVCTRINEQSLQNKQPLTEGFVCLYIYIYMSVYKCIYVCMCVWLYIYI